MLNKSWWERNWYPTTRAWKISVLLKAGLIVMALFALWTLAGCENDPADDAYRKIYRGGSIPAILFHITKAERIKINGPCISACTLVLRDRYSHKVTWTDRSWFVFHAAEVNGKVNRIATIGYFGSLPQPVLDELKPLDEWDDRDQVISGKRMHELLADRSRR